MKNKEHCNSISSYGPHSCRPAGPTGDRLQTTGPSAGPLFPREHAHMPATGAAGALQPAVGKTGCESTKHTGLEGWGGDSAARGLEKVRFHSNPKERKCQRMLTRKQSSLSGKESAQGCIPKRLLGRPD